MTGEVLVRLIEVIGMVLVAWFTYRTHKLAKGLPAQIEEKIEEVKAVTKDELAKVNGREDKLLQMLDEVTQLHKEARK